MVRLAHHLSRAGSLRSGLRSTSILRMLGGCLPGVSLGAEELRVRDPSTRTVGATNLFGHLQTPTAGTNGPAPAELAGALGTEPRVCPTARGRFVPTADDHPPATTGTADTEGHRCTHGRASSNCAASRNRVASSPHRPRKCTP